MSGRTPEAPLGASLGALAPLVEAALQAWQRGDGTRRLWARDPGLWTGADEDRWLGWLDCPDAGCGFDAALAASLRARIAGSRLAHVAVLGMGGSSLCPQVLADTFGAALARAGGPRLHVLDGTVPAQVRAALAALEIERTLFVVSSKSGSTIEPNALLAFVWSEVEQRVGGERTGDRFVAITDAGSSLERLARERGFAAVAHGVPTIGGRFSALSSFGLLPGALIGLDVDGLLSRARETAAACAPDVAAAKNPGVLLGTIMGTLAEHGRDKLTLVISPPLASLGGWLEQLIAESTGKEGRGIVPVADEPLDAPAAYGADRLFVYVRLEDGPDPEQDRAVEALERAGHPVVRVPVGDALALGAEFFRWEVATAVAGSLLAVNPFTQPDVESAKIAARGLMAELERDGALPAPVPLARQDCLAIHADAIPGLAAGASVPEAIAAHLARLGTGDYFAINAYLEQNAETESALRRIRLAVRARHRVATTLGYGPRFLHSTGQLHKGGANNGVFLQITADEPRALAIPGLPYSFDELARAQAQGDFAVLVERSRRVLWVNLEDLRRGLPLLEKLVEDAL